MLGFNLSVGRNRQSFGDADAQAFINATGLTSTTEVNAVKTLVANLKTYGLWSKMKAIYPFVSDTVNLLSYSQDFSGVSWIKTGITITTDTTTAPDGTLTADTANITTSGAQNIQQMVTGTPGVTYTYSFYAKRGTATDLRYSVYNYSGSADIIAPTSYYSQTNSSTWSRIVITFTLPVGCTNFAIYLTRDAVTTGTFFVWGAQLELGSSATTYQPIATTPANRFVSQFKYNLKDPRDLDAAFRLAFNGTWAYSKQGATPNGVNGYANTYFLESANATLNSHHISYYSRNNSTGNPLMGASNGTTETNIYPNFGGGFYPRVQATNSGVASTNFDTAAYFIASRITSSEVVGYRNTSRYAIANATVSLNNLRTYYLGANNDGTVRYNSNQVAFSTIGDGLNDTEATNLYTSVQQFNQDLSRQVGVPIVSDADAQSFLNAAQITDLTQANAINTLVVGLKNASLWTKMKAIYPFVGGTATTHKWNLKDPRDLDAAYRLAFFGAWTHSSTGALPNGTNAYADSFITPSINLNANSTHASYYSRTNVTTNAGTEIGTWYSGYNYGIELNLYRSVAAQKTAAIINSGGGAAQINGGSVTPTTGLLVGSRTSNSNGFVSKNGATIGTNTTTVTTQLSTFKIYLGAANNFGTAGAYSNKESAFASIGDGITEAEATTLNTLVTNFETTLGRNV